MIEGNNEASKDLEKVLQALEQAKQRKTGIQSLQSEYNSISKKQTNTATELAYAEIISYNKKNLAKEIQNKSQQQNRPERREEKI